MNRSKAHKNLTEIREHFEGLKKVDGSEIWDDYIDKVDETEKMLEGAEI